MKVYQYKAINAAKRKVAGQIKAPNKNSVRNQLRRVGYRTLSIKEIQSDRRSSKKYILGEYIWMDKKGMIQITPFPEKPKVKDIVIFTRQFATMLDSGVPLLQSLTSLAEAQTRILRGIINEVRYNVENGASLSQAMSQHPRVFDPLYVAMIQAGEASGKLPEVLLVLVNYIEKSERLKSQIKSAMFYPFFIVIVATGVISGMLLFIVPEFAQQFKDSGRALPQITQLVLQASDFLAEKFTTVLAVLAGAYTFFRFYISTSAGRWLWDNLLLNLPVVGELIKKIALGRLSTTLSCMLSSGVSLLEALTIASASVRNKVIEQFIIKARYNVEGGANLSQSLATRRSLIPSLVVSMVAVGESSGELDKMLSKVSDFYEEEVDVALKRVVALIEPITIVLIGGIILVVVIALYLPMFEIGNLVQ